MAVVAGNRIEVFRASTYRIVTKIMAIPVAAISQLTIALYKNGSIMEYIGDYYNAAAQTIMAWSAESVVPLVAGDGIQTVVNFQGGTTIYGAATSPPGENANCELDMVEILEW